MMNAMKLAQIFGKHDVDTDALDGAETLVRAVELGLAATPEAERTACAVALAESWGKTTDLTHIGLLAWMVDHCLPEDAEEQRQALKNASVAPLRSEQAPPTVEAMEAAGVWKRIPGGNFVMGAPPKEGGGAAERPQRRVQVDAFRMLDHTVTNEDNVLKIGRMDGSRLPIVQVTWYEAYAYAAWLGGRLPTEAEWEYACRAGAKGRYAGGNSEAALDRMGWYLANSERQLQPVRKKEPNSWGLHDMHGNVWEWVADWFGPYPEAGEKTWKNPRGPAGGVQRVVRGGCVRDTPSWTRAAHRKGRDPADRDRYVGFRVVLPERGGKP
jgi:formylglycine-generating enzyme required for sulfatase activity